jgi:membrane-associated HD superfamily phosphohydrolase
MFADGVEARARAEHPQNDDEMRTLIRDVIERCQKDGQLDNTSLSQHDLLRITESLVTSLRATYHPRLEYPQEQHSLQPSTSVETPTTPRPTLLKKHK